MRVALRPSLLLVLPVLLLLVAACAGAGALDEDVPAAGEAGEIAEVVDASTAVEMLEERDDLTIIDVRTPEEYEQGHLADAELIDIQGDGFTDRIGELDPDAAYLVYCRTGRRSAAAIEQMIGMGFEELYDAGGFTDLAGAGAATDG